MKTRQARSLAESLVIDIDAAIAGDPRDEAARHTAAASAAIIAVRIIGGLAVNLARIAHALEVISDNTTPEDTEDEDAS